MSREELKKAWDRQWRGKILSTCAQHLDPEGARELGAGWAGFFGGLPEGAKILDIGTGNGIVPLIAVQVSNAAGKGFEVHGADYAQIDPAKTLPEQKALLARVTFHPETPTEDLPFKAGFFDAVTAQHAFEYGDPGKSAAEVARVLKKGGKIRFLIHASGGEILKANLCKIEQSRYILEQARLFDLVQKAAQTGQGEDLKAALGACAKKFEKDPAKRDLNELLSLLWGAFEQRDKFEGTEGLNAWLKENEAELRAQMERIKALEKAARDENGMKTLVRIFRDCGVAAEFSPVKTAGGQVTGWLLTGERQ